MLCAQAWSFSKTGSLVQSVLQGILQQEIAERDMEVLKLTGENKLLRQELKVGVSIPTTPPSVRVQ